MTRQQRRKASKTKGTVVTIPNDRWDDSRVLDPATVTKGLIGLRAEQTERLQLHDQVEALIRDIEQTNGMNIKDFMIHVREEDRERTQQLIDSRKQLAEELQERQAVIAFMEYREQHPGVTDREAVAGISPAYRQVLFNLNKRQSGSIYQTVTEAFERGKDVELKFES